MFDISNTLEKNDQATEKLSMPLLIGLLLLSFCSLGQEKILSGFDPERDIIADNYEAGEFLIYDCEEQHWTCVLENYFKSCEQSHKISEKDLLQDQYSCVPFQNYPTKKSCFQQMLFLTSQNFGTNFCQKPLI